MTGCLENVSWFIFGGYISGFGWLLIGCLRCISIIGVPVGMQCLEFVGLSFFPFGKGVVYGGGVGFPLLNIIRLVVSDLLLATELAIVGTSLYTIIVGIPFGPWQLKLAKSALMPPGSRVV